MLLLHLSCLFVHLPTAELEPTGSFYNARKPQYSVLTLNDKIKETISLRQGHLIG